MRIIGVLDLAGGRAVHARGGVREQYAPVQSVAGVPIADGSAIALARSYVDRLGVTELYVADLEAIQGRAAQDQVVASLTALGAPVWLDAGVSSSDRARHALALGAAHVVVGLETLESYDALDDICSTAGGGRVAFSLDVRDGDPVVANGGVPRGEPPEAVVARVARAGVRTVIVLDLCRVGAGTGPDVELVARVREAAPGMTVLAGGGVRGVDDLARLAAKGCDGALVATALHDGSLDAAGVAGARHFSPTR